MTQDFENYWATVDSRYNAETHKDRAEHAYRAGQASNQTPPEQDFWLDRIDSNNTKENER